MVDPNTIRGITHAQEVEEYDRQLLDTNQGIIGSLPLIPNVDIDGTQLIIRSRKYNDCEREKRTAFCSQT